MKEIDLQKIVTEYPDIVKSIEKLDISSEEQISAIKAKLNLFDGTIVWVREVWKTGIQEFPIYSCCSVTQLRKALARVFPNVFSRRNQRDVLK